jgi:hypothetical protein
MDDMVIVATRTKDLKTKNLPPKNVVNPKLYKVFGDKKRLDRE